MKLNGTVIAAVALHNASVYVSRKVEHGIVDGFI